jgi:hypothetical protein
MTSSAGAGAALADGETCESAGEQVISARAVPAAATIRRDSAARSQSEEPQFLMNSGVLVIGRISIA